MADHNANPVQCITPDWKVDPALKVFTSTRLGGFSVAPYHSMNLGLHVDDDASAVQKNRARLLEAIGSPEEPLWLDQVHGIDVQFIDRLQLFDTPLTADGAFTRECKRVLTVLTADCLPVVIANEQGSSVAVVHAGWRGLAAGVLQSALAHFSENDQLHAWLGPAIGADAFEVGGDVVDAFLTRTRENAVAFKPGGLGDSSASGKFMADLYTLARIDLNLHRPVVVSGGDYCTYTDSDLFHSYRRDGTDSGRMATLAWIA